MISSLIPFTYKEVKKLHILLDVFRRMPRAGLILLGFALFMLVGAFLLWLPISQTGARDISFLDALFTAVSAVSVTGMTLFSLRDDLSLFGQLVVLVMMQVGGLGVMTIMATMVIYAGRHVRLRERLLLSDSFNLESPSGMVALVRKIIRLTIFIEFVSGTLLGAYFYTEFGAIGFYYGYWHAVSAFCNCGLDLFGDAGFGAYARHPYVGMVVVATMLLGGIGFMVIDDVQKKRNWKRLSLNTKLVLVAELVFTTLGSIAFFCFDVSHPELMGEMASHDVGMNSFFMSVSSRMGGFMTFDPGALSGATKLCVMVLMFIGAAPVSTGGGIRTTTMMIIILSLYAWVRGKQNVVIFHRRIGDSYVSKAFQVFTLSTALIFLTTFLLLIFDTSGSGLDVILFESVSAFSTVGFSAGLNGELSNACKVILIFAMFIGRIGVMTMVLTFADRHQGRIGYPTENVTIG